MSEQPTQNRVLTICPSRGRPQLIMEMVQSFLLTRTTSDFIIYLNEDDPLLPEYPVQQLRAMFGVFVLVGPRKYIAEVYNAFSIDMHYEYYCPINDDHYFVTPQWDQKLIEILETHANGWGIAAAEDHLTDWKACQHPSGCIISGKMIRLLGYMVWPKIQHIGIDTMEMKLAQGIGCLFHSEDIVIEHRHWVNGMRKVDDNYRWVYSNAQQDYGNAMVKEYMFGQYWEDIKKIKEAMELEKIEQEKASTGPHVAS